MHGESQGSAVSEAASFRSFAVEASAGRKVGSWPFARFDISTAELRVRLPFPWFTTRSRQAEGITAAVVSRRLGGTVCIRFDDALGSLADVHVHPFYRVEQILGELRRCGYQVVDSRGREAARWRLRHRSRDGDL